MLELCAGICFAQACLLSSNVSADGVVHVCLISAQAQQRWMDQIARPLTELTAGSGTACSARHCAGGGAAGKQR
jgi:hypothetical protein